MRYKPAGQSLHREYWYNIVRGWPQKWYAKWHVTTKTMLLHAFHSIHFRAVKIIIKKFIFWSKVSFKKYRSKQLQITRELLGALALPEYSSTMLHAI